jgi:Mn2+/Fe2+ NRAMP family transporter
MFAIGLTSTGLLGVPTLASSATYDVGAALGWRVGMGEAVTRAKAFYAVLAAMVAGASLDFAGVSPVTLLFDAAVVNGLLAPPLFVLILLVANNQKIMKGMLTNWRSTCSAARPCSSWRVRRFG